MNAMPPTVRPITVYEVLLSGGKPKRRRGKAGLPAKKQLGLSAEKEIAIKQRLLAEVPSSYWAEIQFTQITDTAPDGSLLFYRLHTPQAFPPKADTTPMVECPCCLRKVPQATMETPLPKIVWARRDDRWVIAKTITYGPRCADCRGKSIHRAHGASPSAVAIRQIQMRNLRLETIKLASEAPTDLRREIRRFQKTGILTSE